MKMLGLFSVGVFAWPVIEYLLHRFSGHTGRHPKAFYKEHLQHHAEKDYFAPRWKKVVASFIFLTSLTAINRLWLGWGDALVFSSGFITMYLYYEWVHSSLHLVEPKTKRGLQMRKHHFAHHFSDPRTNYGVSSPLVDHLMGTRKKTEVVAIPKKMAMSWLLSEAGKIKEKYQADFVLR